MSQLDTIVSVVIDRQTSSVSQASFGIPGVMAAFLTTKTTAPFNERARAYSSMKELAADGWVSGDAVYEAVSAIFRQNPAVPVVVVGRRQVAETTPVALTADATWDAALNAIAAENNDWYKFVICPTSTGTAIAELKEAAEWASIEDNMKVMYLQLTETGVLSPSSTTDLAYFLKGKGYTRVTGIYHVLANAAERADAAWLGEGAPFDPGTSTEAYKTLIGTTPDKLTTSQKSAAWNKRANTYTTVGGQAITEKGITFSGEYTDIIVGIDWIKSRLQESVFGALVNQRKIPYDDNGIQIIRGLVQSVLEEAARKGILQIASIDITVPKYANIPQADRIARHLPDVKFTALLQGAIHTVAIDGIVSV